eukprot:1488676-Pyramimonas_sp.AAC.1
MSALSFAAGLPLAQHVHVLSLLLSALGCDTGVRMLGSARAAAVVAMRAHAGTRAGCMALARQLASSMRQ